MGGVLHGDPQEPWHPTGAQFGQTNQADPGKGVTSQQAGSERSRKEASDHVGIDPPVGEDPARDHAFQNRDSHAGIIHHHGRGSIRGMVPFPPGGYPRPASRGAVAAICPEKQDLCMSESIGEVALREAARQKYLNYAMSVITSRALPDVRDVMTLIA